MARWNLSAVWIRGASVELDRVEAGGRGQLVGGGQERTLDAGAPTCATR